MAVLRVAIPRCVLHVGQELTSSKTGKEAFLLVLHTFFLVARTMLSVMVARLDGRIVRDLAGLRLTPRQLTICLGLGKRQGIPSRSGLVVCPCDTQHIYELNGEFDSLLDRY